MFSNKVWLILLTLGVWANIFVPKLSIAHEDQYIYAYQIYDLESEVQSIIENHDFSYEIRRVVENCEVDDDEIDC